jgi:TolB-like protein/DNA-binding winged helix-turn-helix (wHTH) protein/Tfp pilus assembly protein PilF
LYTFAELFDWGTEVPASIAPDRPLICFGTFEVDPSAGELRRNGTRIKLQDQPLQVLLTLLSNPHEVVTREELKNRLWPTDTYVDFDQGLNRAVAKLRDALHETAEHPVYIETIARKGYRFLAPVEWVHAGPTGVASPALATVKTYWLRWAAVATGILVLGAIFLILRSRAHASSEGPIHSIAVLPLVNLSNDPSEDYFADGMTDDLITQLARPNGLSVISRSSVMNYKGHHVPLPQIGRDLHVDAIIEGTVFRSGQKVRITIQLIRAASDRHLWAHSYEEDLKNVVALQDSIAQDVAEQIHAEFVQPVRTRPEPNSDAYEAYLRGRSYLIASSNTAQALERAQTYFQTAIRYDPTFARAYSGLAECYVLLGEFRWLPPNESDRPAKEAITKALKLDQTLAEAHTALAWLNWRYDWDWSAAEMEYRSAVALQPNDLDAHQGLAWFLAWKGKTSEVLAEIEKIHDLDPAQVTAIDRSAIYYQQRDYKALVDAGREAVGIRPDFWVSHYFLAVGYEGSGRLADSISEYKKAVELSQDDSDPTAGLAHAYAVFGKRGEAERILKGLQRTATTTYVSPYMLATIYSGLGEKTEAFDFLEKAYRERSTDLPYFLKADLRVDQLRRDPRFRDLARRIGLSDYSR